MKFENVKKEKKKKTSLEPAMVAVVSLIIGNVVVSATFQHLSFRMMPFFYISKGFISFLLDTGMRRDDLLFVSVQVFVTNNADFYQSSWILNAIRWTHFFLHFSNCSNNTRIPQYTRTHFSFIQRFNVCLLS